VPLLLTIELIRRALTTLIVILERLLNEKRRSLGSSAQCFVLYNVFTPTRKTLDF